jgi:hypothetical protein
LNLHRGGGETEGQHRCSRGNGVGAARDTEVALSAMVIGRMGGGGAASDWRRETKEE